MYDINRLKKIYSTRLKITQVPRPFLFLFALFIVMGIGIADFFFNSLFNIYLLYLFPVSFITWIRGKVQGLILSFLAILVWFITEIMTDIDLSRIYILVINSILRIIVFFSIIFILSVLNNLFKEIKDESRQDYLTGIANIRLFYEHAGREISRMKRTNKEFSLAYIDLDNFKRINDYKGHLEGNRLLKTVAGTMKSTLRSIDIVARIGGDEFVLLLPDTDVNQSKIVMEKVKQELEDITKNESWSVTFSIGVVVVTRPPSSIEEIVTMSDNLMYSIKKTGKNNIRYEEYK